MNKVCKTCLIEKPIADFYKDKSFKSGYRANCKACKDISTIKWRHSNRERYNQSQREQHKKHYLRNRLYRYDLTVEQYNKMLTDQGNRCACCGKAPTTKRPLVVDHCHKTNKVRGLLCYGCNRVLVVFDSPELLASAIAYVKAG